jgi:hypothetical protein
MNEQQLQKMIKTRRLMLSKRRLRKHYRGCGAPGILGAFFFYLSAKGYNGQSEQVYFGVSLLLISLAILMLLNQYFALRLKEVTTGLTREQNYYLVKETLKTLGWPVRVEDKGFVEAYTPSGFPKDLRTGGREMVSIVITDEAVWINSICNLDHYLPPSAFSLGKNRQNVRKFLSTLELLTVSRHVSGTPSVYF